MIRLAIRVRTESAELVLAELLELLPAGVEERQLDEHTVEYAAYGAPGELPELPALEAAAGAAVVSVATTEIADDWHERWREFHRPVLLTPPPPPQPGATGAPAAPPPLRVIPPWERDRPDPSSAAAAGQAEPVDIVIDPGRAFGTGAHATTKLCLELLLALAAEERPRPAVLDVGTGSGVLAIAAFKLGFGPVIAIDNDPEALRAASQNAALNSTPVELRRLDVRREPPPHAPLVLANLLRPLLLDLAGALPRSPSRLIAGGLLRAEADEVALAFHERLGLHERARRSEGEWSALLLG